MSKLTGDITKTMDPKTGYEYEIIPYSADEVDYIITQLLYHCEYLEHTRKQLTDNIFHFINRPYIDMLDGLITNTRKLRSSMISGHVYRTRQLPVDAFYYKMSILVDVCEVKVMYLRTVECVEAYANARDFLNRLAFIGALSSDDISKVISIMVLDKETYEREAEK